MAHWVAKESIKGFDPMPEFNGRWSWQMVPLYGARGLFLVNGPQLEIGITPAADASPGSATFNEVIDGNKYQREAWIAGHREGKVILYAKNPKTGLVEASVEAHVLPERKKKVQFYRVVDGGGRQPKTNAAQIDSIFKEAKRILFSQTNLKVETAGPVRDLAVEAGLGTKVDVNPAFNYFRKQSAVTEVEADFHIFWAWDLEDKSPNDDGHSPLGVTDGNFCIVMDNKTAASTLAHEIGHRFGLHKHSEDRGNLMFKYNTGQELLNRDQIKMINQWCG